MLLDERERYTAAWGNGTGCVFPLLSFFYVPLYILYKYVFNTFETHKGEICHLICQIPSKDSEAFWPQWSQVEVAVAVQALKRQREGAGEE